MREAARPFGPKAEGIAVEPVFQLSTTGRDDGIVGRHGEYRLPVCSQPPGLGEHAPSKR